MGANTRFATAIHAIIALGHAGRPLTSEEIGKSIGTNPVIVRRLLSALGKAGIVRAREGKAGGSELAVPAGKLTLFDVYRAIEPDNLFAFPQRKKSATCSVACAMDSILGEVFQSAESSVEGALKKIKVCDLVRKV